MSRWWYDDGEEEDEAVGMVMNKRLAFSFYIRAATSKTLRELGLKNQRWNPSLRRRRETLFNLSTDMGWRMTAATLPMGACYEDASVCAGTGCNGVF